MRDISKSFGSFSIALSLFGAQQAMSFMRSPLQRDQGQAPGGLDAVANSAEAQLDGYFRSAFEAGDRVQRSAVDLAFGFVDGSAWNPQRALDLSTNVLRESVSALSSLVPGTGGSRATGDAGEPCGWGPMPPAR